ncbi:MAG: hypothetical protein K6G16_01845 [Lachnospiraceae bacterium]|nr:hypothetical protein [Lachnospiraceae bacterium]
MAKGAYGYLASRRKNAVLRTLTLAGISVGIFILGLVLNGGERRNLFSIIAALGAIPTALSLVNLILFLKARPLSPEAHEEIERHRGGLLIRYELEMTSYERTWHISAACVMDRNAVFYTEEQGADTAACEKHIREQLALGGYEDHTVKVFGAGERAAFCARLDQLEKLRAARNINPAAIEAAWQPGTTQTPAGILLSISL